MQENPIFISETAPVSANSAPKKEKNTTFLLAIMAFGIVSVFGLVMTFLNFNTKNSIETTRQEISDLDAKIANHKKDKNILIASMLKSNTLRQSIELKKLVEDFRKSAQTAQVFFRGFSVKNDEISTNLMAVSNSNEDAVKLIIKMMQSYEKNNQQKSFALQPILSISGTPKNRTTPVTFKVVSVQKEATENPENTPSAE